VLGLIVAQLTNSELSERTILAYTFATKRILSIATKLKIRAKKLGLQAGIVKADYVLLSFEECGGLDALE
jgi:hypothetical protein